MGAALGLVGIQPINGFNTQQAAVFLTLFGRPGLSYHCIAVAQAEAPYLGVGDIDIVGAGQQAFLPEESVALVHDLKYSSQAHIEAYLRFRWGHKSLELGQQLLPAQVSEVFYSLGFGQGHQLLSSFQFEFC